LNIITFDIIVLVLDVQVHLYALITCYNLPHKKVLLMFLISSITWEQGEYTWYRQRY